MSSREQEIEKLADWMDGNNFNTHDLIEQIEKQGWSLPPADSGKLTAMCKCGDCAEAHYSLTGECSICDTCTEFEPATQVEPEKEV